MQGAALSNLALLCRDIKGGVCRNGEPVDGAGAGSHLIAAVTDECHVGNVCIVHRHAALCWFQSFGVQWANDELGRLSPVANNF